MIKEWLTPQELANATGYSRQTINKWIKRENWTTRARPGVQGGKARLIYIDERVAAFIDATKHLNEPRLSYLPQQQNLTQLLLHSVQQMTPKEQAQLNAFLLREGVKGLLACLDANEKT